MKKALKWIAIVVGVLVGIILIAGIGTAVYANAQFKPQLNDRPLYEITADSSPEGLERGAYLMEGVTDCAEACHANPDGTLSGYYEEINEGPISGVFSTPNLTPDEATGLGSWSDAEIARAIREGVDKDGVALEVMPSYHLNALSDEDVAAMVGYLRSLEPVENEVPAFQLNTPGKMMLAFGVIGAEALQDPITEAQETPPEGTTAYGEYLVTIGFCRECHTENLGGGPLPFAGPDDPPSANLTPAGELQGWAAEDFIRAVREGEKPSGNALSEDMPRYQMTDEDLTAIFAYLQTIPPVEGQ